MKIIDNINFTLKDDLIISIKNKSKVSIIASYFSIYAYKELKKQLESVESFRFIYTEPTFVQDKKRKLDVNFIFHSMIMKVVCMVQNLRLNFAMK